MPKVKITVAQKLYHFTEIIVEKPEDMPDEEFKTILNEAEREVNNTSDEMFSDIAWELEDRYGLNIISVDNDPYDPFDDGVEIVNVEPL